MNSEEIKNLDSIKKMTEDIDSKSENVLKLDDFNESPDITLQKALDKVVLQELKGADNVVTKHTIHLRVYKKVAQLLNLKIDIGIDPRSINIHYTNMLRIDDKWNRHIQKNFQLSHDEMNAYDRVKSTDYVKIPDLIKFMTIIVRKDLVDRDPNDKEKIIKPKDLYILLGVDGFSGYGPNDMKNYIENLKFGSENRHIETVRNMYSLDIVKSLSGTDAACLIFLALMAVYKKFIKDDSALLIINSFESDTKTYLSKNAKYYKNITQALEQIYELENFYTANVDEEIIKQIANLKASDLTVKSKKRKAPSVPGKRGRKKFRSLPRKMILNIRI